MDRHSNNLTMGLPLIRRPVVAGYFYPADAAGLRRALSTLAPTGASPRPARAVMLPHGSLSWCGTIVGATLSRVVIPRRCVVLGPSHIGGTIGWCLLTSGAYRTPLGDVPVDEACAEALRARCPSLEPDAWAHRGEHAIEVLLPFLQALGPRDLTVVPIIIGSEEPGQLRQLGVALAQVIRMQEEPALLIASADLSHFEPHGRVAQRDRDVIEAICALDEERLAREASQGSLRMCGYGAVACVLTAVRGLGASHGTLARYGTSADAGGDPASATGYAGIIID
jgi:AmmeMemoRadiSam system protein B